MIVDGKRIADDILERCAALPAPAKFCAAVLAGDDAASVSFLKQKENAAHRIGVDFRLYRFPEEIKNDAMRREVGKIAAHKTCGGAIVQLPLPNHLNQQYILNAIPPGKDVDVLGERALGVFYTERGKVLPPAVGVVESICEVQKYDLGLHSVAIVGLGLLIGRPIANWIMRRAKETFLLRSTSDLSLLKHADLVITGVGVAGLIKPDMLKSGAAVIDFGYGANVPAFAPAAANVSAGTSAMRGDFDSEGLASRDPRIAFYTPTPGGTGPILVAKLFENFYRLNATEKKQDMNAR
jgi:5,10-methylene-tetrahydrofolate dehydrogenase/methenyl tetrahydrofolate cyclohydrolase